MAAKTAPLNSTAARTPLIIVGSMKGGVSKSWVSAALVDHFRSAGLTVAALDGDSEAGSLARHYGGGGDDPLAGVFGFDLRDDEQRQRLLDLRALVTTANLVVLDTPAGGLSSFARLFSPNFSYSFTPDDEAAIEEAKAAGEDVDALKNGMILAATATETAAACDAWVADGFDPIVVVPVNTEADASGSVRQVLGSFPDYVKVAVVLVPGECGVFRPGSDDSSFLVYHGATTPGGVTKYGRNRQAVIEAGTRCLEILYPVVRRDALDRIRAAHLPLHMLRDASNWTAERVAEWGEEFVNHKILRLGQRYATEVEAALVKARNFFGVSL